MCKVQAFGGGYSHHVMLLHTPLCKKLGVLNSCKMCMEQPPNGKKRGWFIAAQNVPNYPQYFRLLLHITTPKPKNVGLVDSRTKCAKPLPTFRLHFHNHHLALSKTWGWDMINVFLCNVHNHPPSGGGYEHILQNKI